MNIRLDYIFIAEQQKFCAEQFRCPVRKVEPGISLCSIKVRRTCCVLSKGTGLLSDFIHHSRQSVEELSFEMEKKERKYHDGVLQRLELLENNLWNQENKCSKEIPDQEKSLQEQISF